MQKRIRLSAVLLCLTLVLLLIVAVAPAAAASNQNASPFAVGAPTAVASDGMESAFLQGNYLEVGINPTGGFGAYPVPAGFHDFYGRLGMVADFQRDGWSEGTPPQTGDYMMPGTPFEGYSIKWGHGDSATLCDVFAAEGYVSDNFTAEAIEDTSSGDTLSALSVGMVHGEVGQSLLVQQNISYQADDLHLVVDVTLTNIGTSALRSLKYMRSIDPDPESDFAGEYNTSNSVLYEAGEGDNRALVVARGLHYPDITVGLGTVDRRATAAINPGWDTDPDDILSNPLTGSYVGDYAISLAYRLGTLYPGQSATIEYTYIFSADDLTELSDIVTEIITEPAACDSKEEALDRIYGLSPSSSGRVYVNQAIAKVTHSLSEKYWKDSSHLNERGGYQVFTDESAAVTFLKRAKLPAGQIQPIIELLLVADQKLASTALSEAQEAGASKSSLSAAYRYYTKATSKALGGDVTGAITYYGMAWRSAVAAY